MASLIFTQRLSFIAIYRRLVTALCKNIMRLTRSETIDDSVGGYVDGGSTVTV